ncbi:5-keto-4-deoxyuronate isomerase [Bosea sp. Leaf344]|uniref:5-dehydro-4-deoxy-D-glucuronate isomerase n=1 Tax=Bosea sp. Leaf344 TaxID=1736346 RepID=UPI0006F9D62B|nr:5-dehydro-4-deoxy-D-glucuronate isomerase [Bosea sp. Leaf344]KQU50011.1 5-keto-4-deoxyuronate isomerase [Bosea sp. Leaf344]
MTAIDERQAAHPRDVRRYDSEALREDFLIERIFMPGEIALTYSHYDRMVVGGAMPLAGPVTLPPYAPTGTPFFMARRELGVINIGGAGTVTIDGEAFALPQLDALYVGLGAKEVVFASADAANPAKFYLTSAPAHREAPHQLIRQTDANTLHLGAAETSNKRTIRQYIMPNSTGTNQLVMGMTALEPGSVWNSMPCHTHTRRMEAYLYFNLDPAHRVFHFMGEPTQTRHLLVANEQAVISPNWSIHCGCGTSNYAFVWAMAGDNVEFTDMDPAPVEMLR